MDKSLKLAKISSVANQGWSQNYQLGDDGNPFTWNSPRARAGFTRFAMSIPPPPPELPRPPADPAPTRVWISSILREVHRIGGCVPGMMRCDPRKLWGFSHQDDIAGLLCLADKLCHPALKLTALLGTCKQGGHGVKSHHINLSLGPSEPASQAYRSTPAMMRLMSSCITRFSCRNFGSGVPSGLDWLTIARANPSAIAVFPTPGSPSRMGLFLLLRAKI